MCVVETFTEQIFINDAGQKTVRQLYKTKRGKNKYRYVSLLSCQYCKEDFVPTRRGVHKYCSNSCRSRACKERNNYVNGLRQRSQKEPSQSTEGGLLMPAPAQEKLSYTRIGESFIGAGAVSLVQHQFNKDLNNTIIHVVQQSEQRIIHHMKAFIEAIRKDSLRASKPHKSIDAKDFEDMAKKLP